VIVRIIGACESDFEMSSQRLSILRRCGVSERIIEAMLLKNAGCVCPSSTHRNSKALSNEFVFRRQETAASHRRGG
jgi:hypothetical protein